MKIRLKRSQLILALPLLLWASFMNAQESQKSEEGAIGTETIVVVKAYDPTISDAFKVVAKPTLNDSLVLQQKTVEYTINSVPVASTFTPVKGKAAVVEKVKKDKLYNSYATLGFGNYTTALAEFYTNFELSRTENLGVFLTHNSAQGGLDAVRLDHPYYDTNLRVNLTSKMSGLQYDLFVEGEHRLSNWFGVPPSITLTALEIDRIEPTQNFYGGALGGSLAIEDSFFKGISGFYRYFSDSYDSVEHRAIVKPELEFFIGDHKVLTKMTLDFLETTFGEGITATSTKGTYNYLNVGINPSYVLTNDALTLNLGLAAFVSMNNSSGKNKVFLYPDFAVSYVLLETYVTAFGGIKGGLQQNTYRDASLANPFVSPNLILAPTDQQYRLFGGLKGRFTKTIGYDVSGSFSQLVNQPLYVKNPQRFTISALNRNFDFANSFSYVYDNMTKVSFSGGLTLDLNKSINVGLRGSYYLYDTKNELTAWNLPQWEATATFNYKITPKWVLDSQTFVSGERITKRQGGSFFLGKTTTVLPMFADVNLKLQYHHNDQLSFFVKGNNLTGQAYQKWLDYPVLGLQVLGGVTYKFDFNSN